MGTSVSAEVCHSLGFDSINSDDEDFLSSLYDHSDLQGDIPHAALSSPGTIFVKHKTQNAIYDE